MQITNHNYQKFQIKFKIPNPKSCAPQGDEVQSKAEDGVLSLVTALREKQVIFVCMLNLYDILFYTQCKILSKLTTTTKFSSQKILIGVLVLLGALTLLSLVGFLV